jgi:hypothetical protein
MKPVGACDNSSVSGTCTFSAVHAIDPDSGLLVPQPPVAADGTLTYEVRYSFPDDNQLRAVLFVQAKPSDLATLERFYASHRQAQCGGMIIRAPCPPSQALTLSLPPPPVGTIVRR